MGTTLPPVDGAHEVPPDDAQLEAVLERSRFDIKHAENDAVSDVLFTNPNAATCWIYFSQLHVRVLGDGKSDAPSYATCFLEDRGLRSMTYSGPCPRLMAFMHVWRPSHLRAMVRARALPEQPTS